MQTHHSSSKERKTAAAINRSFAKDLIKASSKGEAEAGGTPALPGEIKPVYTERAPHHSPESMPSSSHHRAIPLVTELN